VEQLKVRPCVLFFCVSSRLFCGKTYDRLITVSPRHHETAGAIYVGFVANSNFNERRFLFWC
jgi:hypothetical protein